MITRFLIWEILSVLLTCHKCFSFIDLFFFLLFKFISFNKNLNIIGFLFSFSCSFTLHCMHHQYPTIIGLNTFLNGTEQSKLKWMLKTHICLKLKKKKIQSKNDQVLQSEINILSHTIDTLANHRQESGEIGRKKCVRGLRDDILIARSR